MLAREPVVVFPPELVTFDGREFTGAHEWESAFDAWCAGRAQWAVEHPGVQLPERILSECPFEPVLPHGGRWARPVPDDGRGVRCDEHDQTVDEHLAVGEEVVDVVAGEVGGQLLR